MAHVNDIQQPHQEPDTPDEQEKGANVHVATVQRKSSESGSLKREYAEWKPGFWSQFPWTGIGCLFGVLVLAACSVVVIYESNGKTKSHWHLAAEPNVLLSILTSLASILITIAVGHGIAISWWAKALKGATVEDLHNSWSFGSSIMAIVTKIRFFNIMALAALCTKFAVIDSALFQKALNAYTALGPPQNATNYVFPIEDFPVTGTLNQYGNATGQMTFTMTLDENYWLISSDGISSYYLNGFQECPGLCALTYRGVGFASSCSYTNTTASRSPSAVSAGNNQLLSSAFTQQWPTAEKNYSHILFNWVTWSSNSDGVTHNPQCNGQLMNLTCELRPAVLDYNVSIQNSSFSIRKSREKGLNYFVFLGPTNTTGGYYEGFTPMDDITTDAQLPDNTVVRILDLDEPQTPGGNTSLGGIALALSSYYNSLSTVSYNTERTSTGSNTTKLTVSSNGLFNPLTQQEDFNDGCPFGYTDPFDPRYTFSYHQLLYNINLLTFMLSDDVFSRSNYTGTPGDDTTSYYGNWTGDAVQPIPMTQLEDETYYYSRYRFAWGAFATTFLAVMLILPSYWGFWKLGRKVSLGPLEIANAFQAPAFSHVSTGNGHVEGVLTAVGKERVKYGAHSHMVHGVKYGFSGAKEV